MKAKKSKGDGVFNKKNGFVSQKGSMKNVSGSKISQANHPTKNTGSVNSLDVRKVDPEIFADGHKKLSGSLLGEMTSPEMSNTFGVNQDQPVVAQDKGTYPLKGKKKLR